MDRRHWLRIGFAATLAGAAVPWSAAAAAPRLMLRLQGDLGLRALPLQLAERLGHWAQEGLELRWLAPADDVTDEEEGDLVVHALSFDRLVRRVLAGAELRLVAALVRAPQLGIGVAARAGPVQAAFLRGARMGVPLGQDVAARLAGWVLAQGWGVAPAQWWPLDGPAAAEQALERGTVQLLVWGDPLLTRLERDGVLRLVADLRHPQLSQRLLGAPLLCACLAVAPQAFEAHGDMLRRLLRALGRTLRWMHTAGAVDLARHADLAGLAHDRAGFLRVLERLRATYSVDPAVESAAVRQSLRLLASLPGGVAYQAADPQRLLPPRGWLGA